MVPVLISCRKEGCMDVNSASYDHDAKVNDGICSYRYLNSVSVTKLPELSEMPSFPNLQFKMVKTYENPLTDNFDVVTDVVYTAINLPITWEPEISGDYLLTDMVYNYSLVGVTREGEVPWLEGTFIPAQLYSKNQIVLAGNDIEIVLEYIIF